MFCENFENNQQESEEKIIFFFLKHFFSRKWSFGHVEWSFDKQARFFCEKSENFLTYDRECKCLNFFPKYFSRKKIPFGHLQSTFENHVEKLSQEIGKISTWYPELDYYFFPKEVSFLISFPWHVESSPDNLLGIFTSNLRRSLAEFRKMKKNMYFKNLFLMESSSGPKN